MTIEIGEGPADECFVRITEDDEQRQMWEGLCNICRAEPADWRTPDHVFQMCQGCRQETAA